MIVNKKKPRLVWLDSLRGFAILFLIVMHYIGAVESRGLVSPEIVEYIKSIFRVATPLFITVFGFTISYIFYGKVSEPKGLKKLILWSFRRLPKVLLGREVIVLLYSFSHPEQLTSLIDVLLYKQFSQAGEILTFYFLAILLTPYVLYFIFNNRLVVTLPVFSILYISSYLIGINYSTDDNGALFRLFFYDVYPFFPFYCCVIFGIYLAILYFKIESDKKRLVYFFVLSLCMMSIGLFYLNSLTSTLLQDLSSAYFKAPPHPAYLLLYIGGAIFISTLIGLSVSSKFFPTSLKYVLSIIGKNSLLAYVLHYLLHFTVPITLFFIGNKNTYFEVLIFIGILFLIFFLLQKMTNYKANEGRVV
ncbi:acyltransferase family protein [Shewanella sp. S1-58-MNA-CIBAN-0166]|uniref:acyltransferase family protein n=1 Tax=Shewanella sp. S1-58-MNA-CIBAN-0166 TaxID=3140467 RepID=UPI00331E000A